MYNKKKRISQRH